MRRLITSLSLISILFVSTLTSLAVKIQPKQKSRAQRTAAKTSTSRKQVARNKRESAREKAAQRELAKRNPLLASALKLEADGDMDRFDQPREAIEWYLQKRLPKGEKHLPVERYFEAKEKIKRMKRFSTARNKNLPSQADANDTEEILDGED